MNDWTIRDEETGKEWYADSRGEAERRVDEFPTRDLKIVPPNKQTDGGTETVEPEVVDQTQDDTSHPQGPPQRTTGEMEVSEDSESDLEAIDELGESLGTDPLSILPSHMVDTIQGQPAVNKRGYAMIAERYGIEVSADVEQYPWDNDEGRCVARATAITEDGREYSGWATACADDGDMDDQVIELAETRSLKRAVSWASGVGIVSYVEMVGELQ